jgi:serine/threonine protein kinase
LISEGGYAFVYRVRDVPTGKLYALKRIKGANALVLGRKEAEVWRDLGEHPNIVRFFEAEVRGDSEVMILNELCTGGTLFQHISSYKEMPEE